MKVREERAVGDVDVGTKGPDELYAPMIEWCGLRLTAGSSDAERRFLSAEFYRALDQVVRREDFSVRDLGCVLGQHWDASPDDPDVFEHINSYCMEAHTVRQYVEAVGQVRTRSALN